MSEKPNTDEKAELRMAADLTAPVPGRVIIARANRDLRFQTSYVVVSASGTVVLIDPYQVLPGIKADAIVSTHKDYDHNDEESYARTAARKSLYVLESFEVEDVRISTVPASHYGDHFDPARPTDIIYVLDVDGIRIAAMGDICQTRLNDAQLSALGRVDVAVVIMEHAPEYGFSLENTRTMLSQLRPRLAFPIHPTEEIVQGLGKALGGFEEASWRYEIEPKTLLTGSPKVVRLAALP